MLTTITGIAGIAGLVDQSTIKGSRRSNPGRRAEAACPHCRGAGVVYLDLGQPLTTLSGGERQRLKLAARLAEQAGGPHSR